MLPAEIFITTNIDSPRFRYVVNHLSNNLWPDLVVTIMTIKISNANKTAVIAYGGDGSDFEVHQLITEYGTTNWPKPKVEGYRALLAAFSGDYFALIFWCLSRYEEYQPYQPDNHNRFPITESALFWANLSATAVVEKAAEDLLSLAFSKCNLALPPTGRVTNITPTFDIDRQSLYGHLSGAQQLGRVGKAILNGQFNEISTRLAVWLNQQKDSANNVIEVIAPFQKAGLNPIAFLLLAAKQSAFDLNLVPAHPLTIKLLQTIKAESIKVGIHPSYYTSESPKLLSDEISCLSHALSPINRSKQHYLKFILPKTYAQLIANGITEDYSMGYGGSKATSFFPAGFAGLRAGTTVPFKWYDIASETETELMVFPMIWMDSTALYYHPKTNLKKAIEGFSLAYKLCQVAGGHFCFTLHNDIASGFGKANGWQFFSKAVIEILTKEV